MQHVYALKGFSLYFCNSCAYDVILRANCYTTTMSKWRHISVPEMFCGWMSGLLDKTQILGFSNPSAAVSAHTWCLPHNHFVLSEKEKGNTKCYHTCAHISMWLMFTVDSLSRCLFPRAIYAFSPPSFLKLKILQLTLLCTLIKCTY